MYTRAWAGSIFPNAAWRLVWALNSLKGPDERILIPGFYDPVKPPSARDRQLMEALPEVTGEYKDRYHVRSFLKGLTDGVDLRAEVFEPTCTICGLTSGYHGEGAKTILPARASAIHLTTCLPAIQLNSIDSPTTATLPDQC